jgi:GH15 family glucan-1,4-alpha-glucosidase
LNSGKRINWTKTFRIPVKDKYKPITGYGIIGNTRTVSLVGFDGSIDRCCMPRFDSPSIFAAILDSNAGGNWQIAPTGKALSTQKYVEYTNILQTEFATSDSKAVVTDFMPCSLADEVWARPLEIHRIVECTYGEISMMMTLKPRLQYGRVIPKVTKTKDGLAIADRKDEMALASTTDVRVKNDATAHCEFRVAKGEREILVLSYGEYEPRTIEEYQTNSQRLKTEAFWKYWASKFKYKGKWSDAVLRSALALKLLVYSPTGAIVAAPTASLPESIGGERNWDYRFSWIRDSANSLWAFHVLGDRSESERYLHWLANNNPSLDLDLRLMYSIDGHSRIAESVLQQFEGYKGSAPVRIGNSAVKQVQMDAYGYMLDALYF